MSKSLDADARQVYRRLWGYVSPHKLVGFIAVLAMAGTALVEVTMVWMVEPLIDDTLVEHQLETARWLPWAFVVVFALRGVTGFATEACLGWIGRSVISSLRRDVFNKFLTLPVSFFEARATASMMSRIIYNVEMVAESVTNVVVIAVRDFLTVIAAISLMIYQSPRSQCSTNALKARPLLNGSIQDSVPTPTLGELGLVASG